MRCSDVRALRQTKAVLFAAAFYSACAPVETVNGVMQSQFTMFWNDRNVAGITIWGYVVGSTWETNSGLMNSNGTMRPAMTWLMGFLGR
jgi:endo-1,4-beta-xylanase